ncbi:hypothetical protein CMK18_00380 [Candidatus Poribacteria bacterium]|nr:hypothetical protein [Candidatus Poribacteria bacterium]
MRRNGLPRQANDGLYPQVIRIELLIRMEIIFRRDYRITNWLVRIESQNESQPPLGKDSILHYIF